MVRGEILYATIETEESRPVANSRSMINIWQFRRTPLTQHLRR